MMVRLPPGYKGNWRVMIDTVVGERPGRVSNEARPVFVAWVSLDEQDNDSKVLLGDVARALDAVRPVARPVFDALASPASSVPGSVVPRLGNAFAAMTVPMLCAVRMICTSTRRVVIPGIVWSRVIRPVSDGSSAPSIGPVPSTTMP